MLPLPRLGLMRPRQLAEAVRALADLGDNAVVIAGGTDLLPNMKQGLVDARTLVSLEGIESLRGIRLVEDDPEHKMVIAIGAMTSLDTIGDDSLVGRAAPALAEAARAVGGPHHRRMGTLGGNLCLDTRCRYYNQTYFWRSALGFCLKKDGSVCHVVAGGQRCVAAASNDTAPALIALGGTIVLESIRGRRTVDARSFYTADGIRNTTREPDEIVVEARIPVRENRLSGFEKLRRRNAIDFPLLSIAAVVDAQADKGAGDKGASLEAIEIVVSALAARPRRLAAAQKVAKGTALNSELVRSLARSAHRECHPLENIEGDSEWRREMVPVVLTRLLDRMLESSRSARPVFV